MRKRVKRWRRARTPIGRVRQWVLHRVLWYETETCDNCGRKVKLVWWADPDDWERAYECVVGVNRGAGGTMCPACFTAGMRVLGLFTMWHPIAINQRGADGEWEPIPNDLDFSRVQ